MLKARISLLQLRGKFPQVTFRDDGFCYRAEAPHNHTLDGDLHEFIAEYRTRDGVDRIGALTDLSARLEYASLPECKGACDWCERD